jgi:hypothetical protein
MVLRVELHPELGDEIQLGFEEVNVLFLVVHQRFEQIAGDIVLYRMAVGGGLFIERARLGDFLNRDF